MLLSILLGSGNFSWRDVVINILAALIVIFLTMPIHEFAHAWAASKLGDPTPRYNGRLSINPFNHIDYMGALCILLFGFGWAKPVGVNPRNFDNPKVGMGITAAAGPASNLILALITNFISFSVIRIFPVSYFTFNIAYYFAEIFYIISYLNVSLAIFNLLPIPPLDGSRLLGIILPDRIYYKIMRYEQYIYYAVLALIFLNIFDAPMRFLTLNIMHVLDKFSQNILF